METNDLSDERCGERQRIKYIVKMNCVNYI